MKFYQYGRSMVEMLGVLAIIGVLSVGAIAGYSKAMWKYKINKSLEQISLVFNVTYKYLFQFKFDTSSDTHTYLTPYFIKLGEIPENMIKDPNSDTIYDILDNNIKIYVNKAAHRETILAISRNKLDARMSQEFCYNVMRITQSFYDDIIYVQLVQKPYGDAQRYTSYKGAKLPSLPYKDLREENFMEKCTIGTNEQFFLYVYFSNSPSNML